MRVNEKNRHLVSDIIVGYYSRENFSHSELIAKRYGPSRPNVMTTSGALDRAANMLRSSAEISYNSIHNSEYYDEDDAHEQQPLPSLTPITIMDRHSNGHTPGIVGSGSVSGNNDALLLARRTVKCQRRIMHQLAIRRKAEERENARRRLMVEKERRDREVARAMAESEAESRDHLIVLQQATMNQSVLQRVVSPLIQTTLLKLKERASTAIAITNNTKSDNYNNNILKPTIIHGNPIPSVIDTSCPGSGIGVGEKRVGNGHDNDVANLPQLSRADRIHGGHLIDDVMFAVSHDQINPSRVLGDRRTFGPGGSWEKNRESRPPRLSEGNVEKVAMSAIGQENQAEKDSRNTNDSGRRGTERRNTHGRNSAVRFAPEAEEAAEDVGPTRGKEVPQGDERIKLASEIRAHKRETDRQERTNHERGEEHIRPLVGKTANRSATPVGLRASIDGEKRLQKQLQKRRQSQEQQQTQHKAQHSGEDRSKSATGSREKGTAQRSEVDATPSPEVEKVNAPVHHDIIDTLQNEATPQSRISKEEKARAPPLVESTESSSVADPQGPSLGKISSDNIESPTPQAGANGTFKTRRKPSEDRIQEPRAVFVHRASLIEATAARMNMETGNRGNLDGCAELGDGRGDPYFIKRRPSKPGVGSLPMPS